MEHLKRKEALRLCRRASFLVYFSLTGTNYLKYETRGEVYADQTSGPPDGAALPSSQRGVLRQHRRPKRRLVSGEVRFIFVVDIYNEGVDIPEVNTVLPIPVYVFR